jgi:hypothetical protein
MCLFGEGRRRRMASRIQLPVRLRGFDPALLLTGIEAVLVVRDTLRQNDYTVPFYLEKDRLSQPLFSSTRENPLVRTVNQMPDF